MSDSITDVAVHLSTLLQSKENELKEREAAFTRKVQLFEHENPSTGTGTDVLQLNVGGRTGIAVLRRTLTQFEDSMLAATFSGRWDDSLEKDRDGNIFVNQNPENFLCLVDYLLLRSNRYPQKIPVRCRPKPTYEFCSMLEYYGLMPAVYPQTWIGDSSRFSCNEKSFNTLELSSKNIDDDASLATTVLHNRIGGYLSAGVSEFTVVFEKGSTGAVGWFCCDVDQVKNTAHASHLFDKSRDNSFFLNTAERKIFGPKEILEENMRIDHIESTTKITCRHDGYGGYSIDIVDAAPFHSVTSTLVVYANVLVEYERKQRLVFPMVSFSGNVTVSDFKYDIDQV